MLTKRLRNMTPSATVEMSTRIEELRRNGIHIVAFNIGEPDFDTPENIREAAHKAINEGYTKYTEVAGTFELRKAICEKLNKENDVRYQPDQIVVSNGSKQSLFNAVLALCEIGDEVILPAPYWVSYPEMIRLAQATPVVVQMSEREGFQLNVRKIEEAITAKTKAIITNTPNNPTGAVYSEAALRELGNLAVRHDLYIIIDEVYEKLIYEDARHISIASLSSTIKERTVTVNGFSKGYAMTGWRIGYAAGPREIIRGMTSLQGHMTSGANAVSQKAALEALKGPQESIDFMRKRFHERKKLLVERLREINGLTCADAQGAFYLMPNVSGLFGMSDDGKVLGDSVDVANFLLEKAKIAVVPGAAFGAPDNIRVSYSTSSENIELGMERMRKALSLLT
jgi:aspartate aminotransferase